MKTKNNSGEVFVEGGRVRICPKTETGHFRLLNMPCCHVLLCWVSSRLPNYCPECGQPSYAKLKFEHGHIVEEWDCIIKSVTREE